MGGGTARLQYIDFLKGIGALLVVIGHMQDADFTDSITKLIYGFHMPMFFWISGYLYKRPSSYRGYVQKKFKSLLLPWACFGVFYLLITLFISGKKAFISGLIGLIFKVVRDIPIEIGLWFLPVMFLTCILYALIDIRISQNWIKYVLVAVITGVGCEWTRFFHYLPFGISAMMPCLGFFTFGVWFRQKADKRVKTYAGSHKVQAVIISVLCIVAFGILIMLNDRVSVRMGEYGIPVLGWVNAIAFTVSMFVVSVVIYSDKKETENKLLASITWFGNASLIVLCVNQYCPIDYENTGGRYILIFRIFTAFPYEYGLYCGRNMYIQAYSTEKNCWVEVVDFRRLREFCRRI